MKKKLLSIMLISSLGLSLLACGSKSGEEVVTPSETTEPEVVEEPEEPEEETGFQTIQTNVYHSTTYMGMDYSVRVAMEFPVLSEEDEKKYPALKDAFDAFSIEHQEWGQDHLSTLVELAEEDLQYREGYFSYTSEWSLDVMKSDTNMVSLRSENWFYAGGAHGDYGYGGYSYDPLTGEELSLKDVVKDYHAFLEETKSRLLTEYSDIAEGFIDLDEYFQLVEEESEEASEIEWVMTNLGVTLYFNPYVLGSYSMGLQEINFSFLEDRDFFQEKYLETPENYVVPVTGNSTLLLDINQDGTVDPVVITTDYIYEDWDTDYSYPIHVWYVSFLGETFTLEDMEYRDVFLTHANGKDYLQLMGTLASDGTGQFEVLDLSEKYIYYADAFMDFALTDVADNYIDDGESSTNTWISLSYIDPMNVQLSSYLYMLGTYRIYRSYHTGDNGLMVADEDFYRVYSNTALQTKTELTAFVVDENGVEGDMEYSIPAGTFVRPIRSNDSDYVDIEVLDPADVTEVSSEWSDYEMFDVDGMLEVNPEHQILRLHTELSDQGGFIINGEFMESDLFRGILYAG